MGTEATSTNDRSRTYWTPTMERYFIDLMLEQMHRGNRIGYTFNKQAWTDMLAVFNSKFGSQYDKDVLKSRYTNLWKQFNDVKNLLGHNGFTWDETHQMVVADDYIWDAYIKAHPDARPYKTKAVLNFNDLCLIYGYTTADGRYSRSSHDLHFDDEGPLVNTAAGMQNLAPSSKERPRTDWTAAMDQYFMELMLDQVGRGNKAGNAFTKQAWTDMLAMFNASFGPHHGKRVLRHRYKKLWKYYSDVTFLLKQDGFSWDETQQMIAADDNVWDAYTKAHPHARTYRTKALPNYYDLLLIFGNDADNGIGSDLYPEKCFEDSNPQVKANERKGSQMSNVNDRSRTYWTPPMDRYLIDLLLDQVHKGNKLGQTFISQAWTDMVASFNTQFRSCHDKDVLKNRYKHLRRQYNDIKILLEQSGFSWDDTREMITAEDNIWDAYTKAHPDARSYRVKTIPGYHKLCVIFGEENSDGRYSRLARYADPSSEFPVLITDEEKNGQCPASVATLRINWTPQMDHYFIDLMLEQAIEGNKTDHTFNGQGWDNTISSFIGKFGVQCDKYALQERYMCLRKQHDDINNLLNHNGFTWDETLQMVTADDGTWEAYLKEHPDAISYRNTCLFNYINLSKVCQNGISDERLHCQEVEIMSCEAVQMETDPNSPGIGTDRASRNLEALAGDIHMLEQHKKRPKELSEQEQSKMRKIDDDMEKALTEMAGVVTELVNKKEKQNKSIENAINVLQEVPEIDDDLLLDACDLLEDEKKAKTFLALDASLRKKWLLRKLRPSR